MHSFTLANEVQCLFHLHHSPRRRISTPRVRRHVELRQRRHMVRCRTLRMYISELFITFLLSAESLKHVQKPPTLEALRFLGPNSIEQR